MRLPNTSNLLPLLLSFLLLCNSAFDSTVSARSVRARDAGLRQTLSSPGSFVLSKRDLTPPVPSVEDCKAQLLVPTDKAVFYEGSVEESADTYAQEKGMVTIWTAGLQAFQDSLDAKIDEAEKQKLDTWDIGDYDTFWDHASEAFALLAKGAIIVIIPADANGKPIPLKDGSKWTTIEYPILTDSTQNDGVTSISYLVGSDQKVAPTGAPTRLWPA